MAIVFQRSTSAPQYLKRTTKVLDGKSAYTRMFWCRFFGVSVGDYVAFGELSTDGAGTSRDNVYLDVFASYGVSWFNTSPSANGGGGTGFTPTRGRWFHVAIVRVSSSSFQVYINGVLRGSSTENVSSRTGTYAWISLGAKDSSGSYPASASYECNKEWQAALTANEIRREMLFLRPQRVQGLHAWHPLIDNTEEATGKGSDWTIVNKCRWGDVRAYADTPRPAAYVATEFANAIAPIPVAIDAAGALSVAGQSNAVSPSVALSTQGALTLAGSGATFVANESVETSGQLHVVGASAQVDQGVANVEHAALTVAGQSAAADQGVGLAGADVSIGGGTIAAAIALEVDAAGAISVTGHDSGAALTENSALPVDAASVLLAGQLVAVDVGGQATAPERQSGGGSSRRRPYYVEIDGRLYWVDSPATAAQMLNEAAQRLRESAQREAEQVVAERAAVVRSLGKAEPVKLRPAARTNAPSTRELKNAQQAIRKIYEQAAREAEFRLQLMRKMAEEDERDIEDLILMGEL